MVKHFSLVTGTFSFKLLQNLLIFVLLANIFGKEDFGFVALCFSSTIIFMNLVDFGGRLFIISEAISALPEECHRYIQHWKPLKVIVTATLLCVVLIWGFLLDYPKEEILMLLLALFSGSLLSFANSYAFVSNVLDDYRLEVWINGVFTLLAVIICGLLLIAPSKVGFMLGIFGAALFTYFVAKFLYFRIYDFEKNEPNLKKIPLKELSVKGFPFSLQVILSLGFGYIDLFFIEAYLDREILSEYLVISRVLYGLCFFVSVLSVLAPQKIAKSQREKPLLKATIKKFFLAAVGFAVLAIGTFLILDAWLISVVFGDKYISIVRYSYVICAIVFIKYLQIIPGSIVSILVSQHIRVWVLVGAFIILIISYLVFIPLYQLDGALISLGVSNSIILIMYYYFGVFRGVQGGTEKIPGAS